MYRPLNPHSDLREEKILHSFVRKGSERLVYGPVIESTH